MHFRPKLSGKIEKCSQKFEGEGREVSFGILYLSCRRDPRRGGGGWVYRNELKCLYALLSRTHVGTDRTIKQEQEEISINHVQGDTSGCAKPPIDIDLKVAF